MATNGTIAKNLFIDDNKNEQNWWRWMRVICCVICCILFVWFIFG